MTATGQLSFFQLIVRSYVGSQFNVLSLLVGFSNPEQRTLADMAAGTTVVYA